VKNISDYNKIFNIHNTNEVEIFKEKQVVETDISQDKSDKIIEIKQTTKDL